MLCCQSFLGLRIKSRVLNLAVYEDPEVALDLVRLDLNALVFLFDEFLEFINNLVSNVADV